MQAGKSILPCEGSSLRQSFTVEGSDRPSLAWEHEGNCAYREGKWKLVKRWDRSNWELYDMDADRSEMKDLAEAEPERAMDLRDKYQAWADRVGVVEWNELESARNARGIVTDWMPHPHD